MTSKAGMSVNEPLAEELYKPLIKKFKRRKVYARFKDNMGTLFSKNKNVKYLLCLIDVCTKHAWVKALKDKKCETVLNAFIEIAKESNRKPNKLWVDQGRAFYNKLMQEWLDNNDNDDEGDY